MLYIELKKSGKETQVFSEALLQPEVKKIFKDVVKSNVSLKIT
jgi:hypothetical protein